MRLTSKLCAQHLGRTFKKHWIIQGKRVVRDTGAIDEMNKLGISVKDVQDILVNKEDRPQMRVEGFGQSPIHREETHPNWHAKPCYVFGDSNVLLEGMPQALLLTKTIEIDGMPQSIRKSMANLEIPNSIECNVKNAIMTSQVFDSEQVKLPRLSIADRPGFTLPRAYGISLERRISLLINKLVAECEKQSGRAVNIHRCLMDRVHFKVTLPKNGDMLQFGISAEKMIASSRPLEAVEGKYNTELEDLHPIKCTISIPKQHIYTTETIYPLSKNLNCSHPHTIFTHFNKEEVRNLHGSQVNDTQFQSRNMLKAFAVAATRAKQLYGDAALENISKPILVQSIQTDGRIFDFGVFQLNTLDLHETGDRMNYWFHEPNQELFERCEYSSGKPLLSGYNKDVFRCINAFYNNS